MTLATCLFAALSATALWAADKDRKPVSGRATNVNIAVDAVAYLDREQVKQMLGSDFGGSIVVVEVKVTPRAGKELKIFADDFLLRSYKDGQKSQPFAPSQLAGKSVMMLSGRAVGGGGMMAQENGPVWGGIGGRPRRMPGNGGGIGNSGSAEGVQATVSEDDGKGPKDPLLEKLKEKALPEKETSDPMSGLLYFPLEGKHKPKDLALVYSGQAGKITVEFQ